ncbi:hypothetical protein HNY73_014397 [Argiope bruennichi]|uniref:Uncharacterized protein n=1 Tax=Argiope bruennichi TaxID=94029 RepID=A0A8T0ESZ9_ARGBR|nr:hypothetical protein HNY73_014397 [Argiope bruennichi]
MPIVKSSKNNCRLIGFVASLHIFTSPTPIPKQHTHHATTTRNHTLCITHAAANTTHEITIHTHNIHTATNHTHIIHTITNLETQFTHISRTTKTPKSQYRHYPGQHHSRNHNTGQHHSRNHNTGQHHSRNHNTGQHHCSLITIQANTTLAITIQANTTLAITIQANTTLAITIRPTPLSQSQYRPTPLSQSQYSHYPGQHHSRNRNTGITQANTTLAIAIQALPRPTPLSQSQYRHTQANTTLAIAIQALPRPTPLSQSQYRHYPGQHHSRNRNTGITQANTTFRNRNTGITQANTTLAIAIQALPRPTPLPKSQYRHYPRHRQHHTRNQNSFINHAITTLEIIHTHIAHSTVITTIHVLPTPPPTCLKTTIHTHYQVTANINLVTTIHVFNCVVSKQLRNYSRIIHATSYTSSP